MKSYARVPHCCSPIFVFVLCFYFFLLIFSLKTNIILRKFVEKTNGTRKSISLKTEEPGNHVLHLCVDDLLRQKHFDYRKLAREPNSSNRLLLSSSYGNVCELLQYTVEKAVSCFDALYHEHISWHRLNVANKRSRKKLLHFVFIGDSRIRQQFFNFLKLIPDYDRMTRPLEIPRNAVPFLHGDVDVESRILGLRVSFKWRPIINQTVVETIRQWVQSDTSRPDLLFLSMEVHHMLKSNGASFQLYQKSVTEIGHFLNQLAKLSSVVWLNQYPTVDLYGKTYAHNTYIHADKIHHYNQAVHRIFKNHSFIRIWDSSNVLAEEYVRGCGIYHRGIPRGVFVKEGANPFINCKSYIDCEDYIHTGYVALAEASQLLYNDICNAVIKRKIYNFNYNN